MRRITPHDHIRLATLRLFAVAVAVLAVVASGSIAVHPHILQGSRSSLRPLPAGDLRSILQNQPNFGADIAVWNDDDGGPRVTVGRLLRRELTYRLEPSVATFGNRSISTGSLTPADVAWIFSLGVNPADHSLVTICPRDRTYSVATDQLLRVLVLAPYGWFVHESLAANEKQFSDEGMADVSGIPCRMIKVTTRDGEATLWSAVHLKGLIVKGVMRSSAVETPNFSGLAFELSRIHLGADPALFRTPTGYRQVATLNTGDAARPTNSRDRVTPTASGYEASEGSSNTSPACTVVAVGTNRVILGSRATFAATCRDPDGDVVTYSWLLDRAVSKSLTASSGGTVVLDTTDLAPGTHRITVMASDGFNAAIECSATFEVVSTVDGKDTLATPPN